MAINRTIEGKQTKKQENLEIIYLSPNDLIPYLFNNKQHPQEQVNKLASHIAEVGFDVPVLIDENNVILKGHCRTEAAKKLGLKTIPVIIKKGLTEAQKKALRIADNRLSESPWHEENLRLELEQLQELDYDLLSLGFDTEEVEKLITKVETVLEDFDQLPLDLDQFDDPEVDLKGQSTGIEFAHFTMGEIRFKVDLPIYQRWIENIKMNYGFQLEEQVSAIKGMLQI